MTLSPIRATAAQLARAPKYRRARRKAGERRRAGMVPRNRFFEVPLTARGCAPSMRNVERRARGYDGRTLPFLGMRMKKSTRAALLSALVFPGTGQFLLGRAARGCLFLLPAAAAAAYIGAQVLERANAIVAQLDSGALPLDPLLIAERLSAAPGTEGPLMTLAVVVALLCWAGSIIDALLTGDRCDAPVA
ncbi:MULTISPECIES: hypothetical protein [unclassified Janthinobacterium]|uniref:hypothetical protein n=1 Tax=unclassified Janthinobacterium TaxID=2610881 RepID=UPI001E42B833|nr:MULTISPECIES: hypothetical protein [unclassified Janthinobacterium]MEC5163911.1 hypothetical protein [Janthinobacterium sp. CG_S6]